MQKRGQPLRPDDNPDILHRRLVAYREQTAPLIAYYSDHGTLRSIDGMAPIAEVSTSIEKALAAVEEGPEVGAAAAPQSAPQRVAKSVAKAVQPSARKTALPRAKRG
jgi:adenylate kinase